MALILALARDRRRFIVSGATRNARAISSVVSPPTARKVSATCASVARAGWQHMKTSSSRSSGIIVSYRSCSYAVGAPSSCVFAASVRSAPQAIDGSIPRGSQEPGAGVVRCTGTWPPLSRDRERLLGGFFGELEVTEDTDQRRQDAAPFIAEDVFDQRCCSTPGRISTEPPKRA